MGELQRVGEIHLIVANNSGLLSNEDKGKTSRKHSKGIVSYEFHRHVWIYLFILFLTIYQRLVFKLSKPYHFGIFLQKSYVVRRRILMIGSAFPQNIYHDILYFGF